MQHQLKRAVVSALLVVSAVGVAMVQPAAAATACQTSSLPGGASGQICLTADTGPVTGDTTVSVSVTSTGPGANRVEFLLDGSYLLADYSAPFTFRLPTQWYQDGTHVLSARSVDWNGDWTGPAQLSATFANGNATTPPRSTATFTPRGTEPPAARPLVVAATGDAAGGRSAASAVSDLVVGWQPDMFLYLGDVYQNGTRAEFDNWYGRSDTLFGRLRGVTNPTIGNHEYGDPGAAGYRDYWDNVPSYYSYDRGGWHFVSLDSTGSLGQVTSGTAQFEWLRSDLQRAAATPCTLVYFHHPVRSIGEYSDARLEELWRLLANSGVDLVLTGHDHNYQRWAPLDAAGQVASGGTTQFVAGGGGHSVYSATHTDPRVLASATSAPDAYGALRLELTPQGGTATYVSSAGRTVDRSGVTCSGATPDVTAPTTPAGLIAAAGESGTVQLSWTPASDDTGVARYDVLMDGAVTTTSFDPKATVAPLPGTHTFAVRAVDGAGNVSAVSEPVSWTTVSTLLFSDDFESGGLGAWTTVSNLTVLQTAGATGTYAARPRPSAWARTSLAAAYRDISVRARIQVVSRGTNSCWLKLRSATGVLADLCTDANGNLYSWNYTGGFSAWTSKQVPVGGWHDVELRLTTGSPGRLAIRYDGVDLVVNRPDGSYGTSGVSAIQLGMEESGKTFDLALDDLAVRDAAVPAEPPPPPPMTAPSAPTGVTATRGDGSAQVSWVAANPNGSAITGYTVTGSPAGSCTTTGTTCAITGLTNGTSYTFTVAATNGVGTGPASTPSAPVVPAGLPGAPADVTATAASGSAQVSWTAADPNGSAITGYTVTGSPGGGCTTTGTTCTVTGLANGTSYTFTVVARNAVGTGPSSGPSAAVTPLAVPSAPTGVTATRGDGSAQVSWTAASPNGTAITGYTVTGSPGGSCTTTGTTCTVTGLTNGTSYTFSVVATNAVGTGPASTPSAPVTPAGLPATPTAVTAIAGAGSVQVSWAAADPNGSPVTSYVVTSSPGGATCSTTGALSCTVGGLTGGVAYTFTVRATNGVGTSPASIPSAPVTPTTPVQVTVPDAPTTVTAVAGSKGAVEVRWARPYDGGSPITSFTVRASPGGKTVTVTGSATSATVTGLTAGTTYVFYVAATNAKGTGAWSAASNAVTVPKAGGKPR